MNAFVDTNVLVYAAEETVPQPRKTRIAREVLLLPDLHLSVQVLNEFIANARSPRKLNFTASQEGDWVGRWLRFPIAPITEKTFVAALGFHHRFQLSHWDALILAAAAEAGCQMVYSEDLSDEQDYDGIRIVNPFA
jgi:predicted nucleic acid-binding protein